MRERGVGVRSRTRDYSRGVRRSGVTLAVVLAVAVGADGAVGSPVRVGGVSRAAIALEIVYGTVAWPTETYRLNCDPASGSLPDPAAACSAIAADPQLVLSGPGVDHSCPAFTPGIEVRGSYEGQQVDVGFSGCLSGQDDAISRWLALLPWRQQNLVRLDSLRLDHGLGPLHLGESASTARKLLGPPQTTLSNVDVYRLDWRAGFTASVRGVYGVGYHAGRVVTLISNSIDLTITGRQVASLAQPSGSRRGLRARGLLKNWLRIKCDGASALADHAPQSASTIIRRAVDHPIMIVSDMPTGACAASARLAALAR